ncbi:hypothetical protein BGM19_09970 [Streptomyces agglomeratus]|nr:hypothetical protein BGM19_09970 [Streptomyces agglomeratus]
MPRGWGVRVQDGECAVLAVDGRCGGVDGVRGRQGIYAGTECVLHEFLDATAPEVLQERRPAVGWSLGSVAAGSVEQLSADVAFQLVEL